VCGTRVCAVGLRITAQTCYPLYSGVRYMGLKLVSHTKEKGGKSVRSKVLTMTMKNAFWDMETQFIPHKRHITSPP
jgi:hypothetical protein